MTDSPGEEAPRERLAVNDIMARTFAVQRRGFKPDEVTRYLAQLAGHIAEQYAHLDRLAQERDALVAELEGLKSRTDIARLDVAAVTALLGDEAAEILRSASEAAEAIRGRAEAYAQDLTSRAEGELAARKQELDSRQARISDEHRERMQRADLEIEQRAATRLTEAEEAARDKLAKAAEDAAAIVAKAKAVRSEVYEEVRNRTAQAKAELGELEERRSRLAAVMQSAQLVIGQLGDDLAHPAQVPSFELDDPDAGTQAPRENAASGGSSEAEGISGMHAARGLSQPTRYYFNDLESELAASEAEPAPEPEIVGETSTEVRDRTDEAVPVQESEPLSGRLGGASEVPALADEVLADNGEQVPAVPEPAESAEPVLEESPVAEEASEVEPEVEPPVEPPVEPVRGAAQDVDASADRQASVQGIFARLLTDVDPADSFAPRMDLSPTRTGEEPLGALEPVDEAAVVQASEPSEEAEPAEPEPEPESEEDSASYSLHADYAATFGTLRSQLARRLKRVLQDDQNELLEGLRTSAVRDPDGLVGPLGAVTQRYTEIMSSFVAPVAEAASGLYRRYAENAVEDANALAILVEPPAELFEAVSELADELAGEVHGRIGRVLARHESEDDVLLSSNIGAAFRELKTEFVELLAKDLISTLTNAWLVHSTDVKGVHWIRGPEPGCSDCEDNELAGLVRTGSEFPTGILYPPAHIGCGCLLVPDFA